MALLSAVSEIGWDISVKSVSAQHASVSDVVGMTGLILNVTALVALLLCITALAMGYAGLGTGAGIVALFSFAAGLACFSDRRRIRS